jgi:hypothetical protein
MIVPRLLTEAEFKATFSSEMVDIKGREDVVHSDGVIDLAPYLSAAAASIAPLQLLSDVPPTAVYHSPDRGFDHVLYPCNRSNTYMVVVVVPSAGAVHGHYVIDLESEFGLRFDA